GGQLVVEHQRPVRRAVPQHPARDQHDAADDARDEDPPDEPIHVHVGAGLRALRPGRHPRSPRPIISPPRRRSTARKNRRTVALASRTSTRVPRNAPIVIPTTTGAASPGSMSPARRYTLVPASAVTPMIMLLVVVDTFGGSPITRSWISTFS